MSAQHDIGEHTNELAVALQGWRRFALRGERGGFGHILEQQRKPLHHAVKPQRSDTFGARLPTQKFFAQRLVGGNRCLW